MEEGGGREEGREGGNEAGSLVPRHCHQLGEG